MNDTIAHAIVSLSLGRLTILRIVFILHELIEEKINMNTVSLERKPRPVAGLGFAIGLAVAAIILNGVIATLLTVAVPESVLDSSSKSILIAYVCTLSTVTPALLLWVGFRTSRSLDESERALRRR